MRKFANRIIATITLIAAVLLLIGFIQHFLCIPSSYDENRVLMFHKEPKNTIDVLFIGSSPTYAAISSAYVYDTFGFTSFPYAISGATCNVWKVALKDALRTQSPKLIVVDVYGGGYDSDIIHERSSQAYTIMAHQPVSLEKIHTAKEFSKIVNQTNTLSLIMPFIKYHQNILSNLRSLKKRMVVESYGPSPIKGMEVLTKSQRFDYLDDSSFSSDSEDLDPQAEKSILDFIDYCKSKNLEVLFIKIPTVLRKNEPDEIKVSLRANRILELAKENGCNTLNMQSSFYDIGLDLNSDYYNFGHTNTRGQRKVTKYLGDYIQKTYNIKSSDLAPDVKDLWDRSVVYYEAINKLSEALIKQKRSQTIGESPLVIDYLDRIIAGEDPSSVAEDYHQPYYLSRAKAEGKEEE